MELWKKIALGIGILLVSGYLMFSLLYFRGQRANTPCQKFEIEMTDGKDRQYVDSKEISQYLAAEQLIPEGEIVDADRCREIEEQALQHQMIRTAACYQLSNGDVRLSLEQRRPMLRVMGSDNYFVDTDRQIMPVRSTTATDVMVVTGKVSREMAQNQLFDFVEWLEDDDYWKAQIVQIDVVNQHRIELVPRVGTGVIVLGEIGGYEKKLGKLKKLYRDGFAKIGWKNYREIDLRFKGQIVCR